jgi:hypothetical protein
VAHLYLDWKSPKGEIRSFKKELEIKKWARGKTGRVLNHRLLDIWRSAVNNLDSTSRDIHRKAFSISCGKGNWSNIKGLLESNNHYLIEDTLKYRAAMTYVLWSHDFDESKDWMEEYSPTKQKYTSLNKTLMNMPGNVAGHLVVGNLPFVYLPEPATTRIRLFTYLILGMNETTRGDGGELGKRIIIRSSDKEIKEAIKLMWQQFPSKYTGSFSRTMGILSALNFMNDYGGDWNNINIIGLAKRSIEYHRNENLRRELQRQQWDRRNLLRQKEMEDLKKSSTKKPSIALPKNENIKFLDTFSSVVSEGELMKHCIASYAERAVLGNSYLFHVDYNGEMASVEVSPQGFVKQSYGPRDTENIASNYGRRILSDWAKGLQ